MTVSDCCVVPSVCRFLFAPTGSKLIDGQDSEGVVLMSSRKN